MTSKISAVWVNDGADKVTQDELRLSNGGNVANSIWQSGGVTLFGAMNEVISFNLILEAAAAAASAVTVTLSNLTGPGGSVIRSAPRATNNLFDWTGTEAELFFVRYLQIKGMSQFGYTGLAHTTASEAQYPVKLRATTGLLWANRPNHDKFFPEIAVPIELVRTFSITAPGNQAIWADIYIPKTVTPGAYSGTITVKESGVTTHTVPVALTVMNFTLSDAPTSKSMAYCNYVDTAARYTGEAYPAFGSAHDLTTEQVLVNQRYLLHRHKISFVGDDGPVLVFGQTGSPSAAYVPFLTGAAFSTANGYAGPGLNTGNDLYAIGSYGSWQGPGWSATQADFWSNSNAWESWFAANSPSTERFVYLTDESGNFGQTDQFALWMANNPGVGKNLKSFATIDPISSVRYTPDLNITAATFYCGLGPQWQAAVTAIETSPGKEFWMYNTPRPGSGTFATEADGTDLREKPWGQYKKKIGRWFFYEVTLWNAGNVARDVFNQAQTYGDPSTAFNVDYGLQSYQFSNGDGVLLYPGTDAVFPSSSYGILGPIAGLRLKHWRRGTQDVDYLALAAAINPTVVTALVQTMVPQALWELPATDPADPTYYLNVGPSWSSDPNLWEAARAQLAAIIAPPVTEVIPVNMTPPNVFPLNTAIPRLNGDIPQTGVPLSAGSGIWSGHPISFTYQWNRSAGGAIAGATGITYTLVPADVGNTLTVSVKGVNSAGTSVAATSVATAAAIAEFTIPLPSRGPFVQGTAPPPTGTALTANTGMWTNSPTSFNYQWNNSNGIIAGATSSTYTPVAGDVGLTIWFSTVANNATGSWTAYSDSTLPVIALASGVPINTAVPAISGTAKVGQTLAASNGTWTNSPASYTFQWNRAGTLISGATASTYVPVPADVGNTITVSVTAVNGAGSSSPATSAATSAVIAIIPTNSVLPAISGTAKVGQTLAASNGTWTNSPVSYSYQWAGNGTNIAGATASTYIPVAGDVGHTLTVSVVATNSGGSSTAATSTATAAVTGAALVPVITYVPLIFGVLQVGNKLTSGIGVWANNPTGYTYQWLRNGTPIAGATSANYTPAAVDGNTSLTCTVTAHNAAGTGLPATSNYLVRP